MAFLVTGPILGAHVLAKSGVSSRSVSWFTLEWLRRPTRCPRAPFAKQSRCQSQENADASGPPIMETEITKRVPTIKRFVTACNCLPYRVLGGRSSRSHLSVINMIVER